MPSMPGAAPIDSFPAELIAHTLFLALFEPGKALGGQGRQEFANYRLVCKHWRNTAFSTPDLWKSLEINVSRDFGSDKEEAKARMSKTLDGWFGRKGEGVGLHLAFTEVAAGQRVVSIPEIMKYLGETGFQFKTLQFKNFELHTADDVEGVLTKRPATETMKHLTLTGDGSTYIEDSFLKTLRDAFPHLEALVFDNLWPRPETLRRARTGPQLGSKVSLKHNHLQSLTFAFVRIRLDGLTTALDGLPDLQELVFRCCSWTAVQVKVKVVPSVQRFIVVSSLDRDVLRALSFPSLTYFQVLADLFHPWAVSSEGNIIEQLEFFLQQTNLQSLTLDLSSTRTTPVTLKRLLQRLPTIRRLGLFSPTLSLPNDLTSGNMASCAKEVVFRHCPAYFNRQEGTVRSLLQHFAHGEGFTTAIYLPGKGFNQPSETRLSANNGLLDGAEPKEVDGVEVGVLIHQVTPETVDAMLCGDHGILCHEYDAMLKSYLVPVPL